MKRGGGSHEGRLPDKITRLHKLLLSMSTYKVLPLHHLWEAAATDGFAAGILENKKQM